MTELDSVGNRDDFNFVWGGGKGGYHFCKSARSTRRQCEIRWNVCTMVLLYIYSKILGVALPVFPVIKNKVSMLIKV